jgi:hypothetical protein
MGNGRIRGFLGGLVLASAASIQSGITPIPPELVRAVEHEQAPPSAQALPTELPLPVEQAVVPTELPLKPELYIETYVTGYNTAVAQTDDTPCIAATGGNICGRRNVVACPRLLPLGTVIEIRGKQYICEDRTAQKFDGRFDIGCDKDARCPFKVAGWTMVKVLD